jgi:hypothetical protein
MDVRKIFIFDKIKNSNANVQKMDEENTRVQNCV